MKTKNYGLKYWGNTDGKWFSRNCGIKCKNIRKPRLLRRNTGAIGLNFVTHADHISEQYFDKKVRKKHEVFKKPFRKILTSWE